MIKILSRWSHNPKVYWNLMSIFFWYKNAAVIEREHPMIAGFFRLKERLSRRPGFAVDSLPVHLWKRSKEVFHLFIAWAKFLKEMEEVWLQTRKKSEREEKWLEEAQRIQGEIWQTLKIAEWQQAYSNAKSMLPVKARALLDPFEELSSKILFSRKDLDAFLGQWETLQSRLQEMRRHLTRDGEAARGWLDEMVRIQRSIRPGNKIREWQKAYSRLRESLPSKYSLVHAKFDALSNRALYSRAAPKILEQHGRTIEGHEALERRPWETHHQPDQGLIPHHVFCLHLSRRLPDGVIPTVNPLFRCSCIIVGFKNEKGK
jgi:hypothetical protein